MNKRIFAIVAAMLLFWVAAPASANTRFVVLSVAPAADEFLVTMKTVNLFSRDLLDALDGGVEVRYRYRVALKQARSVWFDRTLREFDIDKAIQYDGLRRVYLVSAQENGLSRKRTEYLYKAEAMEAFASHTLSLAKADTDATYLTVFAYLKEFSNWFPVRVFVNTFADWEFQTETVRIQLLNIE